MSRSNGGVKLLSDAFAARLVAELFASGLGPDDAGTTPFRSEKNTA
jgi:hypothetical protein